MEKYSIDLTLNLIVYNYNTGKIADIDMFDE